MIGLKRAVGFAGAAVKSTGLLNSNLVFFVAALSAGSMFSESISRDDMSYERLPTVDTDVLLPTAAASAMPVCPSV